MSAEITVELIEEDWLGKELSKFADAFYLHVHYSRRNSTAARAVRDLGFSVSNHGQIYKRGRSRADFEILTDRNGKPYGKLNGRAERGSKYGLTALLFPSKYRKEFMVSLRSWGFNAYSLQRVKKDQIKITPSGVTIENVTIRIVPDRKSLPHFMRWLKAVPLPYKEDKET